MRKTIGARKPRRLSLKARVLSIWYSVHSSLWFVPALMLAGSMALAFLSLWLDDQLDDQKVRDWIWAYAGSPPGARDVLSTIAGSMITVAGVVFSVTMVVLAQASAQFGPRLLNTFMRDRVTQVVLGTFVSTFLYCLLVLRGVRGLEDDEIVPHISVALSLLLALASICVLIYFIHHVSETIQAPNLIAAVHRDLEGLINRILPEEKSHDVRAPHHEEDVPEHFEREAVIIPAPCGGYLRSIDEGTLVKMAEKRELVIRLLIRPGRFMVEGRAVALAWPRERVDDRLAEELDAVFICGRDRTIEQDVEFAIDQLVEMAVRALSTGINGPFTAITCVDQLGRALARLSEQDLPSPCRYDGHGRLRVIADPITFGGLVDEAFNQIRQNARSDAAVTIRLLEMIALIAERATPSACEVLLRHAQMIERGGREGVYEELDREQVRQRYERALRMIDQRFKGIEPDAPIIMHMRTGRSVEEPEV